MTITWVSRPLPGAIGYQSSGPWRGVLHTTETSSLPSYSNGAVAPQVTFDIKRRIAYLHYNYNHLAGKALKHPSGTPITNTERCVQIEIIGYCDPAQSSSPYYIGKWTDADYAALTELLAKIEKDTGIPHHFITTWKAYPSSAGVSNGVRMSNAAWAKFSGWCGHQHVPNNEHGDPGNINVRKLNVVKPKPPVPPPLPKGDELMFFAALKGSPAQYLSNGITRRWVPSEYAKGWLLKQGANPVLLVFDTQEQLDSVAGPVDPATKDYQAPVV